MSTEPVSSLSCINVHMTEVNVDNDSCNFDKEMSMHQKAFTSLQSISTFANSVDNVNRFPIISHSIGGGTFNFHSILFLNQIS